MEEKKVVEKIQPKIKFDRETNNVAEAEKLVKEGYSFVGKSKGKYLLLKDDKTK